MAKKPRDPIEPVLKEFMQRSMAYLTDDHAHKIEGKLKEIKENWDSYREAFVKHWTEDFAVAMIENSGIDVERLFKIWLFERVATGYIEIDDLWTAVKELREQLAASQPPLIQSSGSLATSQQGR